MTIKAIQLIVIMLNGQPVQVMIGQAFPVAECQRVIKDPAEIKAAQELAIFYQGKGATAVVRCDRPWRVDRLRKSLQD
ncbi:MAG: hypothetical protein PGN33_20000 [Methylobacterium radiotolerans]